MAKTIKLYVGGRIKNSLFQDSWDAYIKRIHQWSIETIECTDKHFATLTPAKGEKWIALDERGASWTSPVFCQKLTQWVQDSTTLCFLIGPSDGLSQRILELCACRISFSPMTWPHLMARLLLIEQIYRAQQRILNHPYSFV